MSLEQVWKNLVAQLDCVVCKRTDGLLSPPELHHVAEGSGARSDFAVVPLCMEHHRGDTGLHGMGVKRFCVMYRPPGESEYGLLVWTNEDLAQLLRTR